MAVNSFVCAACRAARQGLGKSPGLRINAAYRRAASSGRARSLRLAIIGSGPAGYYVAYRIMKRLPDAFVDMFERLPTPFGLVRFGVAPDHPEVKKSAENLEDVAKWPNFNFIGNVTIGDQPQQLPLRTLSSHYDAIVFAYGASKDKELGIPGEQSRGIYSARSFVGWYNGLPEFAELSPDLDGDHAVVLGQGNVALDVGRILLTPVDELRYTDIAENALEALGRSKIRSVSIVGRRGPLQAPATIKEIRELMSVKSAGYVPPQEGWEEHIGTSTKNLPRQLKRVMDLLASGSATETAARRWEFLYLLSPARFVAENAHLSAIEFDHMSYTQPTSNAIEHIMDETEHMPPWERGPAILNKIRALQVQRSGERTTISADAAFRSIGYLSEPIPGMDEVGITFDTKRGIIPNDIHGRVLSPSLGPGSLAAAHIPGMYCAGWVKRGPTGVIASTLDDAFRTADILVDDWEKGVTFNPKVQDDEQLGIDGVRAELDARNIRAVSWADWEKIDSEEKRRGAAKGKPREKIIDLDEMMAIV